MSVLKALRAYRYFRAGLACFIGVAFLAAGLFQVGGGAGIGDVAWFLLVFAFMQFFAYRSYRRTRDSADDERFTELVEARAQRVAEEEGSVVGKKCAQCDRRIVLAREGARCAECKKPVHDGCTKEHAAVAHAKSAGTYR